MTSPAKPNEVTPALNRPIRKVTPGAGRRARPIPAAQAATTVKPATLAPLQNALQSFALAINSNETKKPVDKKGKGVDPREKPFNQPHSKTSSPKSNTITDPSESDGDYETDDECPTPKPSARQLADDLVHHLAQMRIGGSEVTNSKLSEVPKAKKHRPRKRTKVNRTEKPKMAEVHNSFQPPVAWVLPKPTMKIPNRYKRPKPVTRLMAKAKKRVATAPKPEFTFGDIQPVFGAPSTVQDTPKAGVSTLPNIVAAKPTISSISEDLAAQNSIDSSKNKPSKPESENLGGGNPGARPPAQAYIGPDGTSFTREQLLASLNTDPSKKVIIMDERTITQLRFLATQPDTAVRAKRVLAGYQILSANPATKGKLIVVTRHMDGPVRVPHRSAGPAVLGSSAGNLVQKESASSTVHPSNRPSPNSAHMPSAGSIPSRPDATQAPPALNPRKEPANQIGNGPTPNTAKSSMASSTITPKPPSSTKGTVNSGAASARPSGQQTLSPADIERLKMYVTMIAKKYRTTEWTEATLRNLKQIAELARETSKALSVQDEDSTSPAPTSAPSTSTSSTSAPSTSAPSSPAPPSPAPSRRKKPFRTDAIFTNPAKDKPATSTPNPEAAVFTHGRWLGEGAPPPIIASPNPLGPSGMGVAKAYRTVFARATPTPEMKYAFVKTGRNSTATGPKPTISFNPKEPGSSDSAGIDSKLAVGDNPIEDVKKLQKVYESLTIAQKAEQADQPPPPKKPFTGVRVLQNIPPVIYRNLYVEPAAEPTPKSKSVPLPETDTSEPKSTFDFGGVQTVFGTSGE